MNMNYIYDIVHTSGVSAGELILIHFWGEDSDKEIANQFIEAVAEHGATPVLLQQSRIINKKIFSNANESSFDDRFFSAYGKFDAVLDVFAYQPIVLGCSLEPDKMKLYQNYISKLFETLMNAKRFIQIRIPNAANAEESTLKPEDFIRWMEQAYSIDYTELQKSCEEKREILRKATQITLNSGLEHSLFLDLTDREWHIDAGDGDWPCGEIYIAPQENKTFGSIFFEKLFIEDVGYYEKVVLYVEEGKLTSSSNTEVNQFISSLSHENKVVCELGLGMNPNITELCGYTVLDEKMLHSFHIAIGANHMFGGVNNTNLHMDFVGTDNFELIPANMLKINKNSF